MRNLTTAHRAFLTIVIAAAATAGALAATPSTPATITVGSTQQRQRSSVDGVVEAVRQTVLATQVPGAIVAIEIKAGDAVKAGQVLMRVDARAANQGAAASEAQLGAAQAGLVVARKDWERQQTLFAKGYISQAALDRSEAQFKSAQAQVDAQKAMVEAAHTQSGFFVLRAPYAGVVAEVPVSAGDMAMPGKPLATLYDPGALRVSVTVPQSALGNGRAPTGIQIELPGLSGAQQWLTPTAVQVMPVVDAATHTTELRLSLPPHLPGVSPGLFARAWLPGQVLSDGSHLSIPGSAVLRRGEMTGVYVLDSADRPLLRQVRLGQPQGERVEVLSGLAAGDRVVAEPRSALQAQP